MTEIPQINLNQIERGIEEALRKFTGEGTGADGAPTEITAGERIDKIGNFSAFAIEEASAVTAKDIEETGQAVVSIANDIMAEASSSPRSCEPMARKWAST